MLHILPNFRLYCNKKKTQAFTKFTNIYPAKLSIQKVVGAFCEFSIIN